MALQLSYPGCLIGFTKAINRKGLVMINQEIDSYIVLSPGGHYHDWATKCILIQSNQYAVMQFSAYTNWYNKARFSNSNKEIAMSLPMPRSVTETYEEAQKIANNLNQEAN